MTEEDDYIYKVSLKSIKMEAVFTMAEMNKEWSINFLQNHPLDIEPTYSNKISLELHFWFSVKLCSWISFNVFLTPKFYLWAELSLKEMREGHMELILMCKEIAVLAQFCVLPKTVYSKEFVF